MAQDPKTQAENREHYGQQANEGQYGQGQYTAEGKPDRRGPQGQEIQSDLPETENTDGQQINQDAYSRQNDLEQERIQQQYTSQQQQQGPETKK